jgi:hypothetical protein
MTGFINTDLLVNEYKTPTHWSDLYTLKYDIVPQDIINYELSKKDDYAKNGYGYENKDYASAYAIQVEINSNSDEATYLDLVNKDQNFVNAVNDLIIKASATGEIYIPDGAKVALLIKGKYDFNKYHGLTDHDLPLPIKREKDKTYIDLLHQGYDAQAAWGIEVKSDIQENKPTNVHKADIVFLHILGTSTTVIYLPTVKRSERNDSAYIKIGSVSGFGNWQNVKVDNNLFIYPW